MQNGQSYFAFQSSQISEERSQVASSDEVQSEFDADRRFGRNPEKNRGLHPQHR
jgi:hypothetical protein